MGGSPARYAIGIDLGGTKCAGGIVALADGRVLARQLRPTLPERGGEAVLADVLDMARSLQEEARRNGVQATALGLGVAELVSPGGHVLSNATFDWKDIPIAEHLRTETRLATSVEADVRAAARAESRFGAGRGLSSFLHVTVGTGISSALVIEGVPYPGARGLTGTFASSPGLIPGENGDLVSGPPLEQFAAGPALAMRLAAVSADFDGTAFDVLKLADASDAAAQSVVASAGRALGAAIALLVNILDPMAVVIGGGMGLVEGTYRATMEEMMQCQVWSNLHRDVPLVSARLGKDAGWIGAGLGALLNPHDIH